ncbi:MAG: serine hydrolase domain-containing protein [Pseudomonadota bacterium]|uniref:serine hydrolase domain-containing protein n=1 Tax=Gallaecimonas pentaromativorans TaxID=584787 RepID=UPI00067EC08E|nr:serine hydrolase domain-containing protein [Gallaecimonas pentaromativorans]MED5525931.1 serine hydrolase domain-containing protein [Pseudomonadota bacterium]
MLSLALAAALSLDGGPRPFAGVVLVAKGRDITFSQGDIDRPYVVGSVSKQLTAALVLQGVDDGLWQLDDPIGRYLPALAPWKAQVTLKMLLSHSSGVVAPDKPLAFAPGSQFRYSNLGYQLLAIALARVRAKPFSTLLAGLYRQCAMLGGKPIEGFEEQPGGALTPVDTLALMPNDLASGTMVASARDLWHWNLCLHQSPLLSRASYAAMTTAWQQRPYRWGPMGYGFGLQLKGSEASHSGYLPGYESLLSFDKGQTLVVLENVSWQLGDIGRAFYYEDALRNALSAEDNHGT